MTFAPADLTVLPSGAHVPTSVCLCLCGDRRVSTRWAVRAMQIQYPVHCARSLLCYPHPNLDVSRNFSLQRALRGTREGRPEWIALVAAESMIRWDAVAAAVMSGAAVTRIAETFVLRSEVVRQNPPWFVDGHWVGVDPVDRPDLIHPQEALWRRAESDAPPDTSRGVAHASKTIAVCVPTLGYTSMAWLGHALQLVPIMASTGCLVVAEHLEVGGARDQIIEAVLAMDPTPEYTLFYGDDNLPPMNGLQLLFEALRQTDAKAVSGLYYMKQTPPDTPLLWRNDTAGPLLPGRDFQIGDIVQVDGTGLDFIIFRTEALRAVARPRFRTVMEWVAGQGLKMQTEDAYFWDRWREAHGQGPLVDTRCRVGHYSAIDGSVYGLPA